MVEDTGRVRLSLRRFCWQTIDTCPGRYGYHTASVEIGEAEAVVDAEGYHKTLTNTIPRTDPHWPTKCTACGYVFPDSDEWQVNQHTIYTAKGGEWIDDDLPPGAIREAHWLPELDHGPDGKAYLLRLPNGGIDWSIYGPSTGQGRDGPKWTITGTLPNITASPSINAEGIWHGFLQNGVLNP